MDEGDRREAGGHFDMEEEVKVTLPEKDPTGHGWARRWRERSQCGWSLQETEKPGA